MAMKRIYLTLDPRTVPEAVSIATDDNMPKHDELCDDKYNIYKIKDLIPFGINKYVYLSFYLFVVLFTGAPFWGWDGFQAMLFRSGAYVWECTNPEEFETITIYGELFLSCPERNSKINNMFTIAFSCNFLFSALGGFLLDRFGPKMTSLFGFTIAYLGYVFMAIANESCQTYYAGALFLGISCDIFYMPFIGITQLFPERKSLFLGILGSLRSASFSIPVILSFMSYAWISDPLKSMRIIWFYITIILTIVFFIVVLLLPWKNFKTFLSSDDLKAKLYKTKSRLQDTSTSINVNVEKSHAMQEYGVEYDKPNSHDASSTRNASPANETPRSTSDVEPAVAGKDLEEHASKIARHSDTAQVSCGHSPIDGSLISYITSYEYLCLLFVVVLTLLRSEFFTKSHKDQLNTSDDRNAYSLFTFANIFSFLPGPLVGAFIDYKGILFVQTGLNVAGILMFFFVLFDSIVCKYIAASLVLLHNCFCCSQLHVYVQLRFPRKHFGSITGLASLVAGLFLLTSIVLYNLSVNVFNSFIPVDIFLLCLSLLVFVAIYGEMYFNSRCNHYYADATGTELRVK